MHQIRLSETHVPLSTTQTHHVNGYKPSVQFSHSVVSNSLRPHEPQHARPPCPSPAPRDYLNPCPLSRWCHPTISSSVIPFSSCPQIFPSIRVFSNELTLRIRWPNIGEGLFPLGLTGLISLLSKRLSRVLSSSTVWKYQFFDAQPSLCSNSHIHTWLLESITDYVKIRK